MTFSPSFPPLAHQQEFLDTHAHKAGYCLFWQPGTGKTKGILDNALHLINDGKINAVLVVCPNNIVENWTLDELPKHWPAELLAQCTVHTYSSAKERSKSAAERRAALLGNTGRLAFVAMSYDAINTDTGYDFARQLLQSRNCLLALDESARVKDPSTARAKLLLGFRNQPGIRHWAKYRRIATGTPVLQSPFDAYSQVEIACPGFWRSKGLRNFQAFKAHFGVFKAAFGVGGRQFAQLESYRNLPELSEHLHEIGMFVEYVPGEKPIFMPPARFDLSPAESKLYKEAFDFGRVSLANGTLDLASAMALQHKLRQISSGFVLDEAKVAHQIAPVGSRQKRLLELFEDLPKHEQLIIWGHYKQEILDIQQALTTFYGKDCFVSFDGAQSERHQKKLDFQSGAKQHFVAETSAAGEGLTLINSALMIYYSNPRSTIQRVQSEARISRQGQTRRPVYYDLCGNGTLDAGIRANHEEKRSRSLSLHGFAVDDNALALISHHLMESK